MVRPVVAVLLAVGLLLGPGAWQLGRAQTPTTIDLVLERPVWQLRERMIVTGRLASPAGPLGGAAVRIGINGLLDESPYVTTTAPDGTYRLEFWVEDWWGFGGNSITALFPGDEVHAASDAMTIFQVAPDRVAPVLFTVDPVPPEAIAPGQQVALAGTLRNDRGEPAEGHSVFAVVDAGTDHRAFGRVDDQGRWTIDLTVPTAPGEWSEQFPAYRVPVVFEGDWWLAPAQLEVIFSLARVPAAASPSPTPSAASGRSTRNPGPAASPDASPGTSPAASPAASPTVGADSGPSSRAGAPSWLPVWLPAWVASPAFLVGAGGVLSLVVGAALLSHARRD